MKKMIFVIAGLMVGMMQSATVYYVNASHDDDAGDGVVTVIDVPLTDFILFRTNSPTRIDVRIRPEEGTFDY